MIRLFSVAEPLWLVPSRRQTNMKKSQDWDILLQGFHWSIVDLINTSEVVSCMRKGNHLAIKAFLRGTIGVLTHGNVSLRPPLVCSRVRCAFALLTDWKMATWCQMSCRPQRICFKTWLAFGCTLHWELNLGQVPNLPCHASWNWDTSLELRWPFLVASDKL